MQDDRQILTAEEVRKVRIALERAARKIEQIAACNLYMKAFKKAAKIVREEKPD